jgi:hypothetical protein
MKLELCRSLKEFLDLRVIITELYTNQYSGFRLCHLREWPELLLPQFFDDVRLFAVGDCQFLVNGHLHETRLVRQFLEL